MIDVAYRTVDSPVGKLLLAATDVGLVRVAFAVEGHDLVLDRLAGTVSPRVLHYPRRLDTVARELDEYFAGARREFDLRLDFQPPTRSVASPEIEYGHTASYSVVAAASGSPRAVPDRLRQEPTAVGRPLSPGGAQRRQPRAAGGPELKAILLDLEAGR
ncbi:hypothetical protein GCM10020255_017650 [Rhodococcus baikonurensis]